jgi:hypothetical protein
MSAADLSNYHSLIAPKNVVLAELTWSSLAFL